ASLVTINDPLAPTAGGASGSLFGGGFVRGTVTAGVGSASDSTGIKALVVRVDGSVVARAPDRICDFTRRAPCPQLSAPESFAFPSTNIPDGTHSAEIGVVDTGENFTAAAAGQTITVDNTAPLAPAPSSPASITTAAAAATITWAEPGGQVAPITSAHVTVCGPTGCQTSTQAAGSGSGGATVSLPSFGAYNVSVALGDAAGNFAAGQATTWTITRPAPPVVAPMPPAPLPLPTPAPTKASPRLAAARPTVARDRRTIAVRGTVAPGVAGKVTVKATARIHGRARTVTRSATIRNRRYAVRLALPSAAWRTATVTASFAGDASHRSSRITRHVTQRRH
ncbi:MAG: hypothetical protein QOH72_147, partial [Solirubrobacteraceae bacterium]|nr:hypothetical protein [Solirubrobacteraceae bacterium]